MIDVYLAAYCGVVHLEPRSNGREWNQTPKCIGIDAMHHSGWGVNVLNFDNSVDERTTAVGIVKTFEFNDVVSGGLTCGSFFNGYKVPAYCLPFVRTEWGSFAIDTSVAPIKGYPIMGVVKYRWGYDPE